MYMSLHQVPVGRDVPTEDITGLYRNVRCVEDIDELLRMQITHFFDHYKDLETAKWVDIKGWEETDSAHREILEAITRFESMTDKPNF
jgi:inorganic pyrophosphatase